MTIFALSRCVVRMNPDAGIDPVVRFGERNPASHSSGPLTVTDRQDLADPGIPGPLQHRVAVGIEARIIKVGVESTNMRVWPLLQPGSVLHVLVETDQDRLILGSDRSRDNHAVRFQPAQFPRLKIGDDHNLPADQRLGFVC